MRILLAIASAACLAALPASPASAIVGGTDVPEGERGYVAYISIDNLFSCTGTLVTPTWVVTAGHCSTVTAGTPVNVPIGKLGQEIEVTLGSVKRDDSAGEKPGVASVVVHPDYVFTNNGGSSADVAMLELATPSVQAPVKVVAKGEEGLFAPGTLAQVAGFGVNEENGSAPAIMQQAQVPIVSDDVSAAAYGSFEPVTQIGAGYPQGGIDTCQGDSGGPLLVPAPDGSLRLVGDTSYGEGCARPNRPGIYGRLGSDAMRDFIASNAPDAIAPPPTAAPAPAQPGAAQPTAAQPSQPPAMARKPAKRSRKPVPCSRQHRGSARHNRSARHKRQVRSCLKKRRQAAARARRNR